tara:strand:+ start:331 stop:570 length:240 start_codon:yes stop_codon:yes gene_type:complete
MKSQIALEFINNHIADGKTILIRTYTRITKITPKTFKNFEDANHPLFKINSKNELLMAEGKRYVCIATPDMLMVGVSAQ